MSEVLEFPYRPQVGPMLAAVAFFGVCAAAGVAAARTNDRGMIISGLITLSPGGATIFWWCLAAVSALFVAGGVYGLSLARSTTRTIRLTGTELSAPRNGFARGTTVVPLAQIRSVGVGEYGKQRWLAVESTVASLHISESMMPDRDAFARLHSALVVRAGAAQPAAPAGHRSSMA